MADLIIKPATGDGNKLILQDKAGGAVLTTADSGATFANATIPTITGDVTITGDIVPSTPLSHRNFFINGGFDVWQRGTSLTAGSSYLADRWVNATSEAQTRQTFTVGQTDVTGSPTYYHRGAGGSTEWYELRQRIEAVGVLGGQTVTLSYWMKGSGAFTNAPYRNQNFGSGGSGSVSGALATHSVTTSWVRYSQTFTIPSISGKTVGTSSYTQISLVRANNNNIVVDVANCQLELGSNATPFEHRSYGDELLRCQRYFCGYHDNPRRLQYALHDINSVNSGNCFAMVYHPVQLRTDEPTFTPVYLKNGSGTNLNNTNFAPFVTTGNQNAICIQKKTDNVTTNQTVISVFFKVDAEL